MCAGLRKTGSRADHLGLPCLHCRLLARELGKFLTALPI